jgi:hypothetical protein
MKEDSAVRVEMAIRGAHIAKQALELLAIEPCLARMQLVEIVKAVREADNFLKEAGK